MDKKILTEFLEFMKLPEVTPLVPIGMVDWLVERGFFTAPASTKYHGAYEGGLYAHSFEVARTLVQLTKDCGLMWRKSRSPYVVGMFHDLCKIDQYRHPTMGETLDGTPIHDPETWEYNPDTLLKGHGDKSVIKDIPTQRLIELAMAEAAGLISILPSAAERARQDAQINEPLTFEELKKMDGKPVWLNTLCEWFFVDASCEPILLWGVRATCYSTVGLLGELYRRPPKEA